MTLSFALAFAALQALSPATPADSFPDAYQDPTARILVEQARARRDLVEGRIQSYSVISRSRFSVGLRALRRDRMFYRCENASRIEWNRGDTIRIEVLGAREVVPIVSGAVRAGDGECGDDAFDPTTDRLGMALGGGMTMSDSSFLRHPLGPGSERDYRFRTGGTTSLRLADGTTIQLIELQVIPRRSEPFLVSGSLWLEDRGHAVVRAVLRLARAYDYDRDLSRTPGADDTDDEVPRILRPLTADLRYMTIEYGFYDQQWWLPRLIAFEGEAKAARLLAVPLKLERTYSEYRIAGIPEGAPIPELPAMVRDSVCRSDDREGREVADSADAPPDAVARDTPAGPEIKHGCQCRNDRCQPVVTRIAADSSELVNSAYLPPSIFDTGDAFITEREMDDLLASVASGRRPPWQLTPLTWRVGLQGFDLVRYNRVEGLSVGASGSLDLGRAMVEGTVRLGVADLAPNFELAAMREGAISRQRVAVYRRLDAVGPGRASFSIGSSLSALLFGRDDGDYFRSWGVELGRQAVGEHDGIDWRLFAELQRPAEKHTDFSVASRLGDAEFRPNIAAEEVEQVGLQVRLGRSRGSDPTGWRGAVSTSLLASAGSHEFVQPGLRLSGAAPLPGRLLAAIEINGGTTFGTAPLQSQYFLGGGRTVRGYSGNSAHGEAYWTGRAEVATSAPGGRLILFSDAGWAGDREQASLDPYLLSVGAGVSVMDGLLRMDAAHALRNGSGWRFELQIDAGL